MRREVLIRYSRTHGNEMNRTKESREIRVDIYILARPHKRMSKPRMRSDARTLQYVHVSSKSLECEVFFLLLSPHPQSCHHQSTSFLATSSTDAEPWGQNTPQCRRIPVEESARSSVSTPNDVDVDVDVAAAEPAEPAENQKSLAQ